MTTSDRFLNAAQSVADSLAAMAEPAVGGTRWETLTYSGDRQYSTAVFGGMAGGLKAAAAYDAISKSGAEIIVNPQYVVTAKGGFLIQNTTVDVTGFKGTITSLEYQGPGPMPRHQH